jgi:hypothetical protein
MGDAVGRIRRQSEATTAHLGSEAVAKKEKEE